jgi:hypothetical protein
MLESIRAWLNGTRDYNTGALLFNLVSPDKKLASTFAAGYTLHNNWRLQEEMLRICAELKKNKAPAPTPSFAPGATTKKKIAAQDPAAEILQTALEIQKLVMNANPELYQSCLDKAKSVYKEAMNKKAVLFFMIPAGKFDDPNRPDLVDARRSLSLEVVSLYNEASQLFDDADFVKLHGHLPYQEKEQPAENYDEIPDHLVKQTLDNARKNYNKIKKKPVTPERTVSIQLHEHKIKILEKRWHSFKHIA